MSMFEDQRIYGKMQEFVAECYVEPDNIPIEIVQEEDILLFLMLTGQLKTYDMSNVYICVNKPTDLHY
jgi:hypothetical protein